ncbi:hypothetical protein P168DRAFT_67755 [Aspergillus campestris IBT 28561]|uniref:Shugoshin n=1 Tax=Aspergillus campestris (strain IBT 28561) TaxID=1392248 RepID=A0A2I1CTK6_ASPC2|nr:uncharacterized protein P168DRAFT_67755 [Aspergillus campestris IBT 28561]PKY00962.1 hypothetical protein P168DRAFT_67755 [Aspergillus campestris IBT 28561]
MARLNESTAATESFEILKRRFVRQNREIARVNSIQSLRIRSLEAEVSHLLSENVSLREKVITLNQEIERLDAARLLHDGVNEVKTKLENKLLELNGLVSDLGALPRKFKRSSDLSDETAFEKPTVTSSKSADGPMNIERNSIIDGGKLPVILEDKYYPRQTLDPEELQQMVNNDSDAPDSPELEASTPQPDLEHEDLCQEHPEDPVEVVGLNVTEEQDEEPLPPTLERRKKKKPITTVGPSHKLGPASISEQKGCVANAKSKRKFMMEENEEPEVGSPDDDGFQFSRAACPQKPADDSFQSPQPKSSPSKQRTQSILGEKSQGHPKRKMLEPKSANSNVISPKKRRATDFPNRSYNNALPGDAKSDENQIANDIYAKESKGHQQKNAEILYEHERCGTEPSLVQDDASSLLQAPSISLELSGYNSMDMASNAPARPTRRQRAVVSYAEPNLRDKMRRPTKGLIAAVSDQSRRSSNSLASRASMGDEDETSKQDNGNKRKPRDSNSNDREMLAIDHLDNGSFQQAQPSSMVSQRKRNTLSETNFELQDGARQFRRHSSNPRSARQDPIDESDTSMANSGMQAGSYTSALDAISTLEGRYAEFEDGKQIHDETIYSQSTLPTAAETRQMKRGQRAAARRRSMLL